MELMKWQLKKLVATANGILSALFPTGYAIGIHMESGVDLIVYIGFNTVETNGDEFIILKKDRVTV